MLLGRVCLLWTYVYSQELSGDLQTLLVKHGCKTKSCMCDWRRNHWFIHGVSFAGRCTRLRYHHHVRGILSQHDRRRQCRILATIFYCRHIWWSCVVCISNWTWSVVWIVDFHSFFFVNQCHIKHGIHTWLRTSTSSKASSAELPSISSHILLSINIRFLSEQYLSGTLFLKPASTQIP